MATASIMHVRDHKNGAKFDGTCNVVDTNFKLFNTSSEMTRIKIMFKFTDNFELAINQTHWMVDIGTTASNHYRVGIKKKADGCHLAYEVLDQSYEYDDLIEENKIHNVVIGGITSTWNYECISMDKYWNNPIEQGTINNTTFPTYTSTQLENLTIGTDSDGNYGLTFTLYSLELEGTNPVTSVSQKYLFDGYQTGSDLDKMYFHLTGGYGYRDIFNRPSDFWAVITDISDYVSDRKSFNLGITTNETWQNAYPSLKLELFNCPVEICTDDVIYVKFAGYPRYLFIVNKITQESSTGYESYYVQFELYHFLKELDKLNLLVFSSNYYDPRGDVHSQVSASNYYYPTWWCSILPTNAVSGSEYYFSTTNQLLNFLNIKHIFQRAINFIQFEKLAELDITNWIGDSLYYDGDASDYIDYDKLAVNQSMFKKLGETDSTSDAAEINISDVISQILLACFSKMKLYNGKLYLYKHDYDSDYDYTSDVGNDDFVFTSTANLSSPKVFSVNLGFCENGNSYSPDLTDYSLSAGINDDVDKFNLGKSGRNIENVPTKYDVDFIAHLVIGQVVSSTFEFMSDATIAGSYVYQLADILNNRLIRDYTELKIKTSIDQSFSNKFYTYAKNINFNFKDHTIEFYIEE